MKNHPVHQLFLAGILAVSVSACGAKEPEPAPVVEPEETVPEEPVITWEEVYDEGIKLLKKEDYKAAAGKFTDATYQSVVKLTAWRRLCASGRYHAASGQSNAGLPDCRRPG